MLLSTHLFTKTSSIKPGMLMRLSGSCFHYSSYISRHSMICRVINVVKTSQHGGKITFKILNRPLTKWTGTTHNSYGYEHYDTIELKYKFATKYIEGVIIDKKYCLERTKTKIQHVIKAKEKARKYAEEFDISKEEFAKLYHEVETKLFVDKL